MNFYLEAVLRVILGFQLVFWGLNGFFNWVKIPPSGPVIENFVAACIQTKFIMPTVKIFEIFLGLFLIFGFMVTASLMLLAPIMAVVTGLHIFHNSKPWAVLVPFSAPYIVLIVMHGPTWLRLFH